jgi:ABC-type spermidine/putrescine transport system permease subunit II
VEEEKMKILLAALSALLIGVLAGYLSYRHEGDWQPVDTLLVLGISLSSAVLTGMAALGNFNKGKK